MTDNERDNSKEYNPDEKQKVRPWPYEGCFKKTDVAAIVRAHSKGLDTNILFTHPGLCHKYPLD
ncbi:hypothetical protein GOV13_05040 [Candidatus Pacearchaeota archaeon]|nr:hypothetical protein [Candidatus Pacearchaeota archaeon]